MVLLGKYVEIALEFDHAQKNQTGSKQRSSVVPWLDSSSILARQGKSTLVVSRMIH